MGAAVRRVKSGEIIPLEQGDKRMPFLSQSAGDATDLLSVISGRIAMFSDRLLLKQAPKAF